MKVSNLLLGSVGLVSIGLVSTLVGLGVSNDKREDLIGLRRLELDSLTYAPVPPESRILRNPYSQAFPSPGYEN